MMKILDARFKKAELDAYLILCFAIGSDAKKYTLTMKMKLI
jgi:hypothetical protein